MPESDTETLLAKIAAGKGKPTVHKKKAVERSVLDLAYERLHHAFDLFDHICVSFSGGKDGTACLNLTLAVARERKRLPLDVFFFDEEAIPYQTEEYLRRVASWPDIALKWYCLPVKHRNACSRAHPWWSPWDPACPEKWVRPLPPEGITTLKGFRTDGEPRDRLSIPDTNALLYPPDRYGTVGMIMGVRGQESLRRQGMLTFKVIDNYIAPGKDRFDHYVNFSKVYPIYDWQTEDVWTAPARFGWDYNRAYDVMEQCGIPAYRQRCSPAYGEEPMQGFFLFKSCFPEIWDRMSVRVPGANGAMLYSRTELFGYSGNPEKPEGMSWQDFIVHFLKKYPEEERKGIADAIQWCINYHFSKTSDPILSTANHPISGLSWRFLLNLAIRGDFKGRRSHTVTNKGAPIRLLVEDPEKAWAVYNQQKREEGYS